MWGRHAASEVAQRVFVGGGHLRPFAPHGSEGISVVGNGGESLSPSGQIRGENLREDFQSPRASPHVHWGLGQKWARIVSEAACWAEGPESTTELVQRSAGEGAARPGGWGEGRAPPPPPIFTGITPNAEGDDDDE